MRHAWMLLLVGACGGGGGGAARDVEDPVEKMDRPPPRYEEDEDEDGFEVESERGKLDPDDVSAALEPHNQPMLDCYLSQVGKRKWLGGMVEVKWEVGGDGAIQWAQIAASNLGAWPIEKCILDVAREVAFPAPRGNKAAETSIPVELPARRDATSWDDRADALVAKRIGDLDACAEEAAAPDGAIVTVYIGARGKVQEAGFSAVTPIETAWADCAYQVVTGWSLSDPKGQVVKMSFGYPP